MTVVDDILLRIADGGWPIEDGLPIGSARATMTLERSLIASALPGQVRTQTGFSIGSATTTFAQPRDRLLTPWSQTSDRRISTGNPAQLVALDLATGAEEPLGSWQVKKVSGGLTSGTVRVELNESQYAGRGKDVVLPTIDGTCDPAWMVDVLARQCGFYSTPRPGVGSVYNDALCGHGSTAYSTATGIPGIAAPASLTNLAISDFAGLVFTANVAGEVIFRIFDRNMPLPTDAALDVRVTPTTVSIRWNSGAWSTTNYTGGLDTNWPTRVQFRLTATGATTWSVQARSSAAAAWSTAATLGVAGTGFNGIDAGITVHTVTNGGISGLDIATGTDPGAIVWEKPTARISLLDGTIEAPWLDAGADPWTGLRDVCSAFAGVGWVSRHGLMTVINRHELAGSGRPKTVIDVDTMAEDIGWTQDDDDFADRLEVTWHPVTWAEVGDDIYEDVIGDRLRVPARSSATIEVDLGQFVRTLTYWANINDDLTTVDLPSQWEANTTLDGTGSEVRSGITVTNDQRSPSRVLVTVTNSNAFDVYMVDFDGQPGMTLRGSGVAKQETPQTITYGVQMFEARQPLTIDLGMLAQSEVDARRLASYLWERVNTPRWRADSVRLPVDWTRDLGDILVLQHPDTGLDANALVTRISIDASAGSIRQVCDVTILPPTWGDFDMAWAGQTWDDFDAAWLGKTWTAFDNDPLKTEA